LIRLWRECRAAGRVPRQDEIDARLTDVGMQLLELDATAQTLSFVRPGVSMNLGGIGKGYALDRVVEYLCGPRGTEIQDFLLHGGQSSLIAQGTHTGCEGWPVGIGNPLFTDRRLGTIVLRNQAMATSGSNIQYYRVGSRRYGHILDPHTGWPVEGTLSVTAIAVTAAKADALSTAFYVMGSEKIAEYCRQHANVGAIVIPFPRADRRVQPCVYGVDPQQIYWDPDQIRT
jgi:thiamine biosynthesis lipoprotein